MAYNTYRPAGFPKSTQVPADYDCSELYTVKSGDTLYAIAQEFGVSAALLMQVNRILNPYALKVGQQICIPVLSDESGNPVEVADPEYTYHNIAAGDTLYMISRQYGIPLSALMRANPEIDPYNLRVGMVIRIPRDISQPEIPDEDYDRPVPGPAPVPQPMPLPEEPLDPGFSADPIVPVPPTTLPDTICRRGGTAYTVLAEDSLTGILERYSVNYSELLCFNPDIDFEAPLTGITICIPPVNDALSCPLSDSYFVKSGDSLDSISQKLLIVTDSLLRANPSLEVRDFAVPGTKICIPK